MLINNQQLWLSRLKQSIADLFMGDLPAKALCFNVKQFNGNFGCSYCVIPG